MCNVEIELNHQVWISVLFHKSTKQSQFHHEANVMMSSTTEVTRPQLFIFIPHMTTNAAGIDNSSTFYYYSTYVSAIKSGW